MKLRIIVICLTIVLAGGMSMIIGQNVEAISVKDLREDSIIAKGKPSRLYSSFFPLRGGYKKNIPDMSVLIDGKDHYVTADFVFPWFSITRKDTKKIGWYKYNATKRIWERVTKDNKLSLKSDGSEYQYYQHQMTYWTLTNSWRDYYSNVVKVHFTKNKELVTSISFPEQPDTLYALNIPTGLAIVSETIPDSHTSDIRWEVDDESLATIDDQGFITANTEYKFGRVNVKASIDGQSASKPFFVEPAIKKFNCKSRTR